MSKIKYKPEDFIGKVFTRLSVVRLLSKEEDSRNGRYFECLCSCGNKKIVSLYHLIDNHAQSCGCLNKEVASKNRRSDLIG